MRDVFFAPFETTAITPDMLNPEGFKPFWMLAIITNKTLGMSHHLFMYAESCSEDRCLTGLQCDVYDPDSEKDPAAFTPFTYNAAVFRALNAVRILGDWNPPHVDSVVVPRVNGDIPSRNDLKLLEGKIEEGVTLDYSHGHMLEMSLYAEPQNFTIFIQHPRDGRKRRITVNVEDMTTEG